MAYLNKKNYIRSAVLFLTIICIFYCKLIHHSKDILNTILFKVNQRYHSCTTIFRSKLDTIHQPVVHLMQCCKITLCTHKTNSIVNLCYLISFCQIRISICYKILEINPLSTHLFLVTREILFPEVYFHPSSSKKPMKAYSYSVHNNDHCTLLI